MMLQTRGVNEWEEEEDDDEEGRAPCLRRVSKRIEPRERERMSRDRERK
jgi:hypothetical protein